MLYTIFLLISIPFLARVSVTFLSNFIIMNTVFIFINYFSCLEKLRNFPISNFSPLRLLHFTTCFLHLYFNCFLSQLCYSIVASKQHWFKAKNESATRIASFFLLKPCLQIKSWKPLAALIELYPYSHSLFSNKLWVSSL